LANFTGFIVPLQAKVEGNSKVSWSQVPSLQRTRSPHKNNISIQIVKVKGTSFKIYENAFQIEKLLRDPATESTQVRKMDRTLSVLSVQQQF
jgi:hypothetical protein